VGEDSSVESDVLIQARSGMPSDTAGGIDAVGTARPGESRQLSVRARYNALLRLLGTLRNEHNVPSSVSQALYFDCIEANAPVIWLQQDTLSNGGIQARVFLDRDVLPEVLQCLMSAVGQ
jgi:hypothetical protein